MKKIRKKRKLTEEQKKVLVERITKARAAKKPAAQKSIHESVRNLPEDSPFRASNIRNWIKVTKDKLSGMRGWKNSNDKKQRAAYFIEEGYLHNLQAYLRDGIYRDMFYGDERQYIIKYKCTAMAYYADGTPKRTVDVWYPDIGVYTKEMANESNATRPVSNKGKIYKTRRKHRKKS